VVCLTYQGEAKWNCPLAVINSCAYMPGSVQSALTLSHLILSITLTLVLLLFHFIDEVTVVLELISHETQACLCLIHMI